MRIRSSLILTVLAAAAASLAAQQPGGLPMSLETIRKAVVTVHALDADGQSMASGTGFFVAPEGMVVTAAHVLADAAGCSIELSDGETMRCTVAASDTSKDVLMLQVAGTAPAMLRWGSSTAAKDGEEISVVSNPLGQLPGTLSKGIISASRVVHGNKLFQISAAISHGSSGAPLLNAQSQVIGVIRSTIERGQALNFATATDAIRNMHMDPAAVAEAQGILRKPDLAQRTEPVETPTSAGDERSISVGQSVAGRLTEDDALYSDTTYYQAWKLSARPGQDVTIDLSSPDFDPVLIVRGAADSSLVDDDGGPECASRVVFTAASADPITILVNTASRPKRATGRFTLAVSEGTKPVDPRATRDNPGDCRTTPTLGGALRAIALGQTVTGSLTDADMLYPDTTYYQRWLVSTRPGQDVTIDLSSAEFDPVLIVRGAADSSIVDDDGGPGCSSRVVFTAQSTTPDTIIVNTTGRPTRQTGRYTLTVSAGRKPVDPAPTEANRGDCRPPS